MILFCCWCLFQNHAVKVLMFALVEHVPVKLVTQELDAVAVTICSTEMPLTTHANVCTISNRITLTYLNIHCIITAACGDGVSSCSNGVCTCNGGYMGKDCCDCANNYYKTGTLCKGMCII